MKKKVVLLLIVLSLACSLEDTLIIENPGMPDASRAGEQDFTVVLLPDTQCYTRYPQYDTYKHQTQWIVENRSTRNIQAVIHLGDITNNNTVSQWNVADAAHDVLDNDGIPYSMVVGNHDSFPSAEVFQRDSLYSGYFGAGQSRFKNKSWFGGSYSTKNENNFIFFTVGTLKFMVLSLEFNPRKDVLTWANNLVKKYSDRRVIIATHNYLEKDATCTSTWGDDYNIAGREGDDLWNELVSRHSNIFMVVCGHITGSNYRVRNGVNGNPVHEILTDFQGEKVLGTGDVLGNGWLKLLKFRPSLNRIEVRCLSVEEGNSSIFPNGVPTLYKTYYVKLDHNITYDMSTALSYSYNQTGYLFKDRLVNTLNTGHLTRPVIASNNNGEWVVAWQDDRDGNGVHQIYARAFDRDGDALSGEIVVNSVATGEQIHPAVAMDRSGNFVVVWMDDKDKNGVYQIFARGFTKTGSQRFADMTVNSIADGQQRYPDIAMTMGTAGSFVVVWEDDNDQNGKYQIYAKVFNSDGTVKYSDFTVNSINVDQQLKPSVAMDYNGNFVVAWEDDNNKNGKYQIYRKGYNANKTVKFSDAPVNSKDTGQQRKPDVSMSQNGISVITWEDDSDDNGYYQIRAIVYNASGSVKVSEFTVNSVGDGQQRNPSVAMNSTGNFAVAWEDDNDGNDTYQIYAKAYNSSAAVLKADFTVNRDASGQQYLPATALDSYNHLVTVWQDDMDGDGNSHILAKNTAIN